VDSPEQRIFVILGLFVFFYVLASESDLNHTNHINNKDN